MPAAPIDPEGIESEDESGRRRRCAVSGVVAPESGLIRFVADPQGQIVPDLAADLPGRGVWVTADRDSMDLALKKGAFGRSLKASVTAAPDLADQVQNLLERRCLAGLGLARKSGVLVTGFEKAREQERAGSVVLLAEASDGAEDGRAKLLALLAKSCPGAYVLGAFSKSQMGLALGMENVVHACLSSTRHAVRLARDVGRLGGFRSVLPAHWVIPETLNAVTGIAGPDRTVVRS